MCVGTVDGIALRHHRLRFNAARSIVCVGTQYYEKRETHSQFQCRTQHCVCRDWKISKIRKRRVLFQCRTQHCVCRDRHPYPYHAIGQTVSMPHAALCVSGLNVFVSNEIILSFQCRTQHCVCRDAISVMQMVLFLGFQCRTQHCVCRDSVSRSPCPARAEKVFWKDALFLRRFWRLWMNSAPKSGGSIGAVPCAVRATPFWKVETAVCGFTPVPKHFPFPSPL